MLTSPCTPENRVYTKALSSLELSSGATKDLLLLLDEILEVKQLLILLSNSCSYLSECNLDRCIK